MGAGFLAILKSIGKWLLPIFLKEFKDWIMGLWADRNEKKEKAAALKKKTDQLVKDSQRTEGMTDDELAKKQEDAWNDFTNKPRG